MQERITQQSNDNETTEPQTSFLVPVDNSAGQQLTIEIPSPDDVLYGNSQVSYSLPLHMPYHMNEQTQRSQINEYSSSLLMPHFTVKPNMGQQSSPNSPEMYIVKNTERSDGESVNSSEEDEADACQQQNIHQCSKVLNSSTDSTSPSNLPSSGNGESSSTDSEIPKSKENDKKKKLRTNYTPSQVQALERVFLENAYPDSAKMESLANDLDIAQSRIKIWFQNKRARCRKRTNDRHQPMQMPPVQPITPYGLFPPHHPMLHGSPSQVFPGSYYYPGHTFGMPPHSVGFQQFHTPQPALPITPKTNMSPTSTTSSSSPSESSPVSADTKKLEFQQMNSQFHHTFSPIQPYVPFSYPYGRYPPYYC